MLPNHGQGRLLSAEREFDNLCSLLLLSARWRLTEPPRKERLQRNYFLRFNRVLEPELLRVQGQGLTAGLIMGRRRSFESAR